MTVDEMYELLRIIGDGNAHPGPIGMGMIASKLRAANKLFGAARAFADLQDEYTLQDIKRALVEYEKAGADING